MTRLILILPFYDETAYLRGALGSIAAQPIDDVQVIVVNDNPEQFSRTDLAALCAGHPVELIQQPRNLGLSAARNAGLAVARGAVVGFLDSDDYYTAGGLAAQLELAEETGADITHAPTWFTRKGNPDLHLLPRDAAFFSARRTAPGLIGAEEAQFITSSWSSLYRRAFLEDRALRFDEAQRKFEDRLFVLHTVTAAERIAFLGRPTRVWRGRGGSISVSATTPETHLLQLQLLEKCLSHMRAEVSAGRLPRRFEKRELFNCVSRLIWDMDLVDAIARGADPVYRDMAPRIPALLGADSFGHPIFDDPVLSRISRVGMTTRRGRIGRRAFFSIHKALREGDLKAAHALIAGDRPAPRRRHARAPQRLVLHLGLHKTGSTHLQHHLARHRGALAERGVLVPKTGWDNRPPLRRGALTGHQGLAAALRSGDEAPFTELAREIRQSRAHDVVLSCENLAFPTHARRADLIERLADRLGFDRVEIVALARRPDAQAESFYRETVLNGARGGGRGIGVFLVDHGPLLSDFPALFAPLEAAFGTRVKLADFDALRGPGLWPGFAARAGLPGDLPALDLPRYTTPDRETVLLLELLGRLVPDPDRRAAVLRAWFALRPASCGPDQSLLAPAERLGLIDRWETASADFAAERGYRPDLADMRAALAQTDWAPPEAIPADMLHDLFDAATIADAPAPAPGPAPRPAPLRDGVVLRVRLRPWAATLLDRLGATGRRRRTRA